MRLSRPQRPAPSEPAPRATSSAAGSRAHSAGIPMPSPYDWRLRHRMVPAGGGPRALPLIDLVWGAFFLFVALSNLDFLLSYGTYTVYVLNLALCVALALPQFLRLRRLRASFITTYALLAAYALLVLLSPVNLGLDLIIITAVTTLHAVVRWEPDRRWGTAALLLALAGAVVNPATLIAGRYQSSGSGGQPGTVPGLGALVLLSLLFVATVVLTYLHASSRRRDAENHARDLADAAAQATAAERLTMARELHDLVGHSLTAVTVQASTGLALGDPEQMRSALESVRETASASLGSVRELVRALRSETGETAPLADLLTVPGLVGTARSTGCDVVADLPASEVLESWNAQWSVMQRLTLVRLVGEALTNAVKHGGTSIHMRLEAGDGACRLEVLNALPEGPGPAGSAVGGPAGSGLIGLEERLRLVGGHLEAGPATLPDGAAGYRLYASFPVSTAAALAAGHPTHPLQEP